MGRSDTRRPKKNLYESEANLLKKVRGVADQSLSAEEYQQQLQEFCDDYEDLLDQCKLITKVSDRLQNKINTANSKLEEKNVQLQQTIDALTEARVGRRAATYVLIIAVVLFIVSEAWIEPPIEAWAAEHKNWDDASIFWSAIALKGVLVLLLKPIEMIVESTLMKSARKKAQVDAEKKFAQA